MSQLLQRVLSQPSHAKPRWNAWRSLFAASVVALSGALVGCDNAANTPAPKHASPGSNPADHKPADPAPAKPADNTHAAPTPAAPAPAAASGDKSLTGTSPIVIGHFGSLTGSKSTFGKSTSEGVRLAIKEFNAAGGFNGRQIVLKERDTRGESTETGRVVTQLIADEKVAALIGEVASSLSLAAADVAQPAGVPMISPSSTNDRLTDKGDMISRVCFIDSFQGLVCAKFARNSKKASKVAILFDQSSSYSVGLTEQFRKAFTSLGGTIVAEEKYNEGDQDFTAQLTTIRSKQPEMIFIPGYYTEVSTIAIQAKKLGVNVPLLGGDGWDSAQLAGVAGPAIEGSFYSNHYSQQDPSPVIQDFIKRYQAEYGTIPDGLAALGYDAAKLFFDALKRTKSLSGRDLADAIAATKNFAGVTGQISLDANRNAIKPGVIVEMKKGLPTYVETITP